MEQIFEEIERVIKADTISLDVQVNIQGEITSLNVNGENWITNWDLYLAVFYYIENRFFTENKLLSTFTVVKTDTKSKIVSESFFDTPSGQIKLVDPLA